MRTLPIEGDSQKKLVALFGQAPLFQGLTPDKVAVVLGHASLVQLDPGEALMTEGEPSKDLFVLVKGEVVVSANDRRSGQPIELSRLKAPETLGEMGLLLQQPRTATVKASGQVLALRYDTEVFEAMCQKLPFFGLALARGLARRLAATSRLVPLPVWDSDDMPSADVLALLPLDFAERQRVIPLQLRGNVATVGFVEDPDPAVVTGVQQLLPTMQLRPVSISIGRYERIMRSAAGVAELRPAPGAPKVEAAPAEKGARRSSPKLDPLLRRMVAEGASDLHLSGSQVARWRIDGHIRTIEDTRVLARDEVLEMMLPIMDDRAKATFETKDCDFAYEIPGVARFRVNLYQDHGGAGAVLRVIPSKILTFEQLGLPKVTETLCENPKGLVLVTGPTGSGKSTTLAAMIDAINKKRHDHIITLEDPIEFVHKSQSCLVTQREIGAHTASFGRALKAALREDPDIVLVGEMRDIETVALALETANTGHLVFGTLHTATAVSTVDRIINLFPVEQQTQVRASLADVLRGVVAQTLCRKIGGGRVAALEVLVCNFAVANLIREGKNHQIPSAMATGKGAGNMVLNEELARLVADKKVEYEEALAKAVDKNDLAKRCGRDKPAI